jgi:hypothetical protein
MTKSKYFRIEELVPPETFKAMGEQAWQLIDEPMITLLDALREHFGKPIIINNWHNGGSYKYRGFRPKGCKVGKETGEHYKKPLNAVDFNVIGKSDWAVKSEIMFNQAKFLALGLTRIESTEVATTWTHIDRKPTGLDHIKIFMP